MPLLMCPNCQTGMKEITREQILIDICPDCQGVWLDRGELQKLLELNKKEQQQYAPAYQEPAYREPPRQQQGYQQGYQKDRYDDDDRYHQQHKGKHHKKSTLESIFGMFD